MKKTSWRNIGFVKDNEGIIAVVILLFLTMSVLSPVL